MGKKMSMDQFAELAAAVTQSLPRELSKEMAQFWIKHRAVLSRVLREALSKSEDDFFTVTVDYGLSLAEMIAAGRYDYVNSDITAEHFPISGTGKVERKLVFVHLGREATTNEVLAEMKRRGLKPALIEDILAFGAAYPEEQEKFPIMGLGSSWVHVHGSRFFSYLGVYGGGRKLLLHWHDGRWDAHCRFPAFCE